MMYEVRLCGGDKYGVFNSADECLCVFDRLNTAADFVNYIQGGTLDEVEKYHVNEAIWKYRKNFKNFPS